MAGVAYVASDLVDQVDAACANINATGTAPILTGRTAVACAATLTDAVDGIAVNYGYDTFDDA